TSNGRCYKIWLDTQSNELNAAEAASCAVIDSATPQLLAAHVKADPANPLFVYRNEHGATVDPATQIAQAREVDIHLTLDDPSDKVPPFSRVFDYTLGGVFLSNQVPDNSITSAKIVDGAVTNEKIAPGAITGSKFADGTITAQKADSATRSSFVRLPV